MLKTIQISPRAPLKGAEPRPWARLFRWALPALLLAPCAALPIARVAHGQSPPPAGPPGAASGTTAPAAPPSPVSGIRNKISAGDLLSAESILEVHREKNGEDGAWIAGLAWLARGALLVGDTAKARAYAADVRARCAARLTDSLPLGKDHDVEGALGAAIEVQAQLVERKQGRRAAAAFVRSEIAANPGPPAFQSRLHKRLDLLALEGTPAPALVEEERLPGPHASDTEAFSADVTRPDPKQRDLHRRPTVLFMWAEWCADCRAQAASLGRVLARHRGQDLQAIAVTRYYDDPPDHEREKARADSVWRAVYSSALGNIDRFFSTQSMIEYGVSSTPTFVFIDRRGIVRRYTPTRLTEDELEREVASLLR